MTMAVALVGNVASLVVMFRIRRDAAALTRMRRYEHPERIGAGVVRRGGSRRARALRNDRLRGSRRRPCSKTTLSE